MNFTFTFAIGAIIASALGATIALWGNRILENKRESEARKSLMNSLFGELLHVLQHYTYSGIEITESSLSDERKRTLRKNILFAKYGDFQSARDFDRYGFLSQNDVKSLLQLSFRIRNTDNLIDLVLEKSNEITVAEYNDIQQRIGYIYRSAEDLLSVMAADNQTFQDSIIYARENVSGGNT